MEPKITQLIRESNPPAGKLASPTPQYYDQESQAPATVEGRKGAPLSMLVGPDGNPISPATAGGQTAIAQAIASLESTLGTEATLQLVKGVLDAISGKVATQTTAAAILTKLADLATEDTLDDVKTAAETLAGTVADGAQKVTLTGQIQEFAVTSWDDLPPDSVPTGSVAMLIGTDDIRQTDGEEWLPI